MSIRHRHLTNPFIKKICSSLVALCIGLSTALAEEQPATVIAHTGEEGQITRSTGDLSFRLGDFFTANDREQMRLTADGNLGIGTAQPQTRLDVDGFVRASQGIVFPDGSVQFSASRKTYGAASQRPGQFQKPGEPGQEHLAPDISGTGTTGKLAKWQDGPAGILNDANITEVSGAIGINAAPNTSFRLDVNGSTRIRGSNPGFNLEGLRAGGNIWLFQTVDDDGRFRLFSQTDGNPGQERLTIKLDTGDVGIGTNNPQSRLSVQTINFSYGLTHTNGTVTVGTYVDPTAGWFGTRSNHPLNFFTNGRLAQMTLMPTGNFGIGTVNPQQLLHVSSASGNAAALVQTPTNAFAQLQLKSGATNICTVGTQDNFAGNALLFRYGSTDLMTIKPDGNVTQSRDKGGMVKAMVYMNGDGTLIRCYNGVTGSSSGNCGFTASRVGSLSGLYQIDFGFQVTDRFIAVR